MRPMEAMPTSNSMVFFHTKQLLVGNHEIKEQLGSRATDIFT
jgi:hypothetical protein